ncbi:hypothetical protein UY3_07842 [Chelonia mydas]|uniref:Uncharacterized protein n=1 Tax=Chelonia mydas TaxID=8469 RepID=M7BSC2_CHEMY|nr:hypothetical protein UY3_07842 [Chelonia mydas]
MKYPSGAQTDRTDAARGKTFQLLCTHVHTHLIGMDMNSTFRRTTVTRRMEAPVSNFSGVHLCYVQL